MSGSGHNETRGILYAGGAYCIWGIVPLYWHYLEDVPPLEITFHRIAWCALTGLIVTLLRGRLLHFITVLRTSRLMMALAASSLLISSNWTIYIYCVSAHRLIEASLGYYLTPLVSIALGVVLLGEKVSRVRLAAIALATAAVIVQAIALGSIPWIAPALALTFGFYGYVRKLTPVDSLDGLTIETCLLVPVAVPLLAFWAVQGTAAFPSPALGRDALLLGTGPLTAVPLVLFAAGARRIRMTTLGFLQYLSPTITLLVATLVLGEPFTRTNVLSFACVWSALVLVSLEGRIASWSGRTA
ncbi:MAG TPA: EamA family transporter RarD [Rhizomicrobium sp.]|nr:EamA family transporter RarD [Rhizomicrobium sp.]